VPSDSEDKLLKRVPAIAAILLGLAAAGCQETRASRPIADLIVDLPNARKQPSETAFEIGDVSIDGISKRALLADQSTRLTYHVTVPARARFVVSIGVAPRVWDASGQGVLFLIGVSDGQWFQTKSSVALEPFTRAGDRTWRDLSVSLEEFAGLTVDIILNTRPTGPTPGNIGHIAVWGTPLVVVK